MPTISPPTAAHRAVPSLVAAFLAACITVEAPAEEMMGGAEAQEAGQRSRLSGDDAPSDDPVKSAKRDEGAAGSGAEAVDEAGESVVDENVQIEAEADGADAQSDAGSADDDAGEGAVDQSYYCGVIRTTVRVCNGSKDTDYGHSCVADTEDCLSVLPADEREDFNEYCFTRTEYHVFGDEAQPGSCEDFDGYWDGELECLMDSHCGSGERCVDHACVCPEGVACQCPNCGPGPSGTCEGDVLTEVIGEGPCDANRQCVYEERITDCAAMGLSCDPSKGACVDPAVAAPGPGPEPDPELPGEGPGTPALPAP